MDNKLSKYKRYIDGLVQQRRNSIANTLELRISCINSTICTEHVDVSPDMNDYYSVDEVAQKE